MKKSQKISIITIAIVCVFFTAPFSYAHAGTIIFFPDSSRLQPKPADAFPNISGNVNWPNIAPTENSTGNESTADQNQTDSNSTSPAATTINQNSPASQNTPASQSSNTNASLSGASSGANQSSNQNYPKTTGNTVQSSGTNSFDINQNIKWPDQQSATPGNNSNSNGVSGVSSANNTSEENAVTDNQNNNQTPTTPTNTNTNSSFFWIIAFCAIILFATVLLFWIFLKASDKNS